MHLAIFRPEMLSRVDGSIQRAKRRRLADEFIVNCDIDRTAGLTRIAIRLSGVGWTAQNRPNISKFLNVQNCLDLFFLIAGVLISVTEKEIIMTQFNYNN